MVGFGMKDAQKDETRISGVQPWMLIVWEKVFADFAGCCWKRFYYLLIAIALYSSRTL